MTVDCLHWFVDGPILSIISHPGIAWSNSNKKRVPVDEGVRVPGHEDHEEDDEEDHGDQEDHEEDDVDDHGDHEDHEEDDEVGGSWRS